MSLILYWSLIINFIGFQTETAGMADHVQVYTNVTLAQEDDESHFTTAKKVPVKRKVRLSGVCATFLVLQVLLTYVSLITVRGIPHSSYLHNTSIHCTPHQMTVCVCCVYAHCTLHATQETQLDISALSWPNHLGFTLDRDCTAIICRLGILSQ